MDLRYLQWPILRSVQKSPLMPTRLEYAHWIRTGLSKPDKTKGGLAKALGVHQSQITRMITTVGKARKIQIEELPIIAAYLESPPPGGPAVVEEPQFEAEAPDEASDQRTVKVVGYVGASDKTYSYMVPEDYLDEVAAPEMATSKTVAARIYGNSLGSGFNRWYAFYDNVKRPVTSDLHGELCIIGLKNGTDTLIKILRPGTKKGRYTLVSNAREEDRLENVEIEWAAKVLDIGRR